MDLSYSAEYEAFRAEVRTFLEKHWNGNSARSAQEETLISGLNHADEEATRFRLNAIESGYLYRHVPKTYGGSEQPFDPLKSAIIAEEFRRVRAPGELIGQGASMLV